jgi:hypothetical protein
MDEGDEEPMPYGWERRESLGECEDVNANDLSAEKDKEDDAG